MTNKQKYSTYRKLRCLYRLIDRLLREKNIRPTLGASLLRLRKDTKAALFFWEGLQKDISKRNKTFSVHSDKLQIGGGKNYLSGFVNLDLRPPADIIWDCRYGLPFSKNTFRFIFSEHFLEHVDFPVSAGKILREIHRVLKPGGELVIGVPDGGKVIKAYYQKDKKFLRALQKAYSRRQPPIMVYGDIDLVNYLFRDQIENLDYSVHYWAYDKTSLARFMRSLGFRKVKKHPFNYRYCNPKRKFFTLYLKAVK